MENKEAYTSKDNNDLAVPITENDNKERRYNSQVVWPIIYEGDAIGSVVLISKEPTTKMNDVEYKVVQSAASFLGNQMTVQRIENSAQRIEEGLKINSRACFYY